MKITWMGTNSLIVETEESRLLFDPFVQLKGATNPNSIEDFENEETIFITHGHFDHLFFVPQIMENGDPTVFCTQTPAQTLTEMAEDTDCVAVIRPGMEIPVGDVKVRTYQGRHIIFDKKLIMKTLSPHRMLRYASNIPFLFWANKAFQEAGETLCYEILAEGKRVMVMGSLALDPEQEYPMAPDLLTLPYQGNYDLLKAADEVLEKIQPKKVMLTHFDNAFPPVSRDVDTRSLKNMMDEKYPQIQVVKPKAGRGIEL